MSWEKEDERRCEVVPEAEEERSGDGRSSEVCCERDGGGEKLRILEDFGDEEGVEWLGTLEDFGGGVFGSRILDAFGDEVGVELLIFEDFVESFGGDSRSLDEDGDDGADDRNDLDRNGDEGADDCGVSGKGRLGVSKTLRKKDAAEGAATMWRIGSSGYIKRTSLCDIMDRAAGTIRLMAAS